MDKVLILKPGNIGKNFIPKEYLPKGKDEYYQRNKQTLPPKSGWRHLHSDEVEKLVKNDNRADNWDEILVTEKHMVFRTCQDRQITKCYSSTS